MYTFLSLNQVAEYLINILSQSNNAPMPVCMIVRTQSQHSTVRTMGYFSWSSSYWPIETSQLIHTMPMLTVQSCSRAVAHALQPNEVELPPSTETTGHTVVQTSVNRSVNRSVCSRARHAANTYDTAAQLYNSLDRYNHRRVLGVIRSLLHLFCASVCLRAV